MSYLSDKEKLQKRIHNGESVYFNEHEVFVTDYHYLDDRDDCKATIIIDFQPSETEVRQLLGWEIRRMGSYLTSQIECKAYCYLSQLAITPFGNTKLGKLLYGN